MKKEKNLVLAAMLSGAMALPATAMAQAGGADTGWYAGFSLGQSSADVDCTGATSCDDSDSSWKIFGGYQLNRNVAIELGYGDLGKVSVGTPAFVFLGIPIPAANTTIESTVFELVGVGSLPVAERFSLFGKIGLYRSDTDIKIAFANGASSSDSDDNIDLTFGVGARYDFTRNLGVRAEWQRYSSVKAADFGESDIDVMSVGLIWKF